MWNGFFSYLRARKLARASRSEVLAAREHSLRRTLREAYKNSKFYRELWEKASIHEKDLETIALSRLPTVNKKMLMEHFADVVTDTGLTRAGIESFIAEDPTGRELFKGRYVVINTSGSSGTVGIFPFSLRFWTTLSGTVAARILSCSLPDLIFGRVRVAFVGEASGHHAGFSLVNDAPGIRTLSVDVSLPEEEMAKAVNAFQPSVVAGYASGLAELADAQVKGLVRITPSRVVSSGEPLSADREEHIKAGFDIRPVDFYGATECLAMGASLFEAGVLDVFDDLVYLEAIDDNGMQVAAGTPGRAVITIFNNDIFPLIRYVLDDELTFLEENREYPFTRIAGIAGRKLDRLSLTLKNGATIEVHPMDLVGLFFPGLKQYQVVQTAPSSVTLRMVVEGDTGAARREVAALIDLLFKEKGLSDGDIDVVLEFVDAIEPNPKTGKTPMIIPLRP